MPLPDQLRKRRIAQGLTLSELARRAKISQAYLGQIERGVNGAHPSADVLYKIAFALGTSVDELLEKQKENSDEEFPEIPEGLRAFALAEQLPNQEIRMLARIEYRGQQPCTIDDWRFIYEAIKRSVRSGR